MNALCILTAYNEAKFLPYKIAWCRANGLTLYVIDNMSDDGTWEYLQRHNVLSHRFDTGGAFDLQALQAEIIRTLHRIKPDWVIYNGADLFPVTRYPLAGYLQAVQGSGYNVASIMCLSMTNTGEQSLFFDPFRTYYYYEPFIRLQMIHRYHPDVEYCADHVSIPRAQVFDIPDHLGVMVNYGNTKTKEEREETLKRREKAWRERGMNPAHGTHYLEGHRRGWVWSKDELTDIRQTPYAWAVDVLHSINPFPGLSVIF